MSKQKHITTEKYTPLKNCHVVTEIYFKSSNGKRYYKLNHKRYCVICEQVLTDRNFS